VSTTTFILDTKRSICNNITTLNNLGNNMDHDILNLAELKVPYLESTTFGDYTIKIERDDVQDSPRDWDTMSTMVCYHRGYNLGDEHGYDTLNVFWHVLSGLYTEEATEYLNDKQLERCQTVAHQKNVILPLYLYDHDGITMSTTPFCDRWDSGCVGYIFMSHDDIRKEYNVKRVSKKMRNRVQGYLESDVKVYDQYLTGEVYWYNVEKDGDDIPDGSCGGFYGYDDSHMIDCIKSTIKYDIENTPQQSEMF